MQNVDFHSFALFLFRQVDAKKGNGLVSFQRHEFIQSDQRITTFTSLPAFASLYVQPAKEF